MKPLDEIEARLNMPVSQKRFAQVNADDLRRLIKALRACMEQRDSLYDGPLPDESAERMNAELQKILEGE